MTLKNKPHRTKHDWYMCVRALASGNATLSHFTISKSYFINDTIPFYNTPNIPKFYFDILHIKIIYLHSKIYFWFFSNFFLLLSSTSITAPPLPSHHHCASTMPTTPPLPTAHQNPIGTKTHIIKKTQRHNKNQATLDSPTETQKHWPRCDPCRSPPNPSPIWAT